MFTLCSHVNRGVAALSDPAEKPDETDPAAELEREVDEAVALCDGDVRAALRAALFANSFLTAEVERLTAAVSFGFTRGKVSPARRASEKLDDWREISQGKGK
jgi:hypothetical protein